MDKWTELKITKSHDPYCERLKEDVQRLERYAKPIDVSSFEKIIKTAAYSEFSSGGHSLPRGYYCPSPIRDLIIGNCNRGKILKSVSGGTSISYQYFFNAAHQLSAVKKFPDDTEQDLYEYEIIRYVDNTSVGLGFTNYGLNSLSECIYRGNQIQSYCNGLYEFPSCRIQELEKECYQYENNRLISADMYVFIPSIGYLSRMSYHFIHDSEGCISAYQSVSYIDGMENKNDYWRDHVFQIPMKARRKL